MKDYHEIIVAFHIGRGGRSHNPGHIDFLPDIHCLQDLYDDSVYLYDADEDGNELPVDKHLLFNSTSATELLRGKEIYEKTGTLSMDYDHDTYDVCRLDEMPDRYAGALAMAVKDEKIDSDIQEEVVAYLSEHGYDIPDLIMDKETKEIYEGLSGFVDEDNPIDPYTFSIEELDENSDARLIRFKFEDIESCCLVYTDGTIFTTNDWQTPDYPKDMDEVEKYEWIDRNGMDTIMLGGLPRTPFWR